MRWWCAAQGVAWDWTWRPYIGVWIFLAAAALAYVVLLRRGPAAGPGSADEGAEPADRGRTISYAGGLLALWIGLDWPVAALGAGYLASLHMVQFLLVALVAPPLLLHGLPPRVLRAALAGRPALDRVLRLLTHPLAAILLFNAIVVVTHWPSVVDGLMASQAGSFLITMAWLGGGLLFWWPVVCAVPARPRFGYAGKVGYLILNTVLNTAPYAFLTFAELPFYATYELAPPVAGIGPHTDQQIAGLVMKLGGGIVLWTAITVIFFRWYAGEEGEARAAPGATPS